MSLVAAAVKARLIFLLPPASKLSRRFTAAVTSEVHGGRTATNASQLARNWDAAFRPPRPENGLPEKSRAPYRLPLMCAETLNCPMCGAAAPSDATSCEHCGARLATGACPSCFGMMFVGEKF